MLPLNKDCVGDVCTSTKVVVWSYCGGGRCGELSSQDGLEVCWWRILSNASVIKIWRRYTAIPHKLWQIEVPTLASNIHLAYCPRPSHNEQPSAEFYEPGLTAGSDRWCPSKGSWLHRNGNTRDWWKKILRIAFVPTCGVKGPMYGEWNPKLHEGKADIVWLVALRPCTSKESNQSRPR